MRALPRQHRPARSAGRRSRHRPPRPGRPPGHHPLTGTGSGSHPGSGPPPAPPARRRRPRCVAHRGHRRSAGLVRARPVSGTGVVVAALVHSDPDRQRGQCLRPSSCGGWASVGRGGGDPAYPHPRPTGAAPAGYIQAWALLADWWAATDQPVLPAEPATVLDFLRACPAATATQRRRVAAHRPPQSRRRPPDSGRSRRRPQRGRPAAAGSGVGVPGPGCRRRRPVRLALPRIHLLACSGNATAPSSAWPSSPACPRGPSPL